jgi:tetratricopeptide (TPR) repeat protein
MSTLVRAISAWCVALLVVFLGCQQEKPQQTPASSPTVEPSDAPARAEALKGERLAEFLTAHQQGLGHMERYEYGQAVKAFRKTVELDPSSTPANINLAIALLNDSGEQAEDAKRARGPTESASNFGEALEILDQVVASEPENLHARYCRGLILEFQGELERAHADFKAVVEGDPSDPYAWLKFGITLPDPKRPGFTASIESAPELVEIYTKALERNPNVTLTLFKLQEAYNWLAVS